MSRKHSNLLWLLLVVASAALAATSTAELVARFQAEPVFWKQADIGDEIARVARLPDLAPLESGLAQPDRHVRANVAYLFAKLGDRRGLDTLMAILDDRSSDRTIDPPPTGLGIVEEGISLSEAMAEWQRSPGALAQQILSDRYYAVHVLGELGDRRSVPKLISLLHGDEIDYNAAWALGQIGDARAIPPLIQSLSSPNSGMRVAALLALEKLHATEALPQINALFDDPAMPQAGERVPVGVTARKVAESIRRPGNP